ncbi:MFS transporter [Actinomadura latina]|uniref:MFS transporter n=1 Tax=Actinomadura latina TaxID=163603 RepID=A0A846YRS7_9ACTN|nr:MFS transporter [Actinomadura latina]NKZ03019.1 MFS transporter [Actinomadura latina]
MNQRSSEKGWGALGLVLVLSAQFVIMLDASIVTVALPDVQRELGFSASGVQAVVTAYNTALGGGLILGGRVGDLFGRRRIFVIGMAGFAASSLLCGLAPNAVMLVAYRVLQGLSAAAIAPTALALLTTSFPEGPARAKAMSKFGIATVLGFIGGLVLSGPLVDALGWQSVFYVTVPVGAVMAALAPRFIAPAAPRRRRLDVLGAGMITSGVALIVVAPAQGSANGWTSPRCVLPLVAGIAVLTLFPVVERRQPEPLVRLGLFRSSTLRMANLVSLASGMMSGAGYLLVTLYLQEVKGCGPVLAGLIVAPVGVLNLALGTVLPRVITRIGLRLSISGATVSAGLLLAVISTQMTAARDLVVFGLLLLPFGAMMLATTVSSTLAATSGVSGHEQGLAGGVRQTSFQLGIALGVAALLSLATTRTTALEAANPAVGHVQALAAGYQLSLYVLGGLVIATGVIVFASLRDTTTGSHPGAVIPNRALHRG